MMNNDVTPSFVIGTAGHVDHGKSTLVKALTGIDPDRLAEEKAREMTIDLGFAWLKLPGGLEVGVIDVPGHEHFIKNMLAGVSGMDLALLIVSAAESIKTQTREHLSILDLMEVPQAIIVITQADLADSDQIALVGMEIEDLIKPTRFAGSPIAAVSAVTGQGLPELKDIIEKTLLKAPPRRVTLRPRLPIDRVFTISGSGTVVTGTLANAPLALGQEVEIQPGGLKARIRGLQTHKHQLENVHPGNRVAVNLVGLSASDLQRGQVLTLPGWLKPTQLLDVRLRLLAQPERPLKHNTEVSLHTGSAEAAARVRLLETEIAQPGQTVWVQLVLAEPLAAINGDRYVIRSPMETLGGGQIVESHPAARHHRFRPDIIASLKARAEGQGEGAILAVLKIKQPLEAQALLAQSNLEPAAALGVLEELIAQGKVVALSEGAGRWIFAAEAWEQIRGHILAMLREYHRKYPLRSGVPKAEISSKVRLGTHFNAISQQLISAGQVLEEGASLRLPDFQIKLTSDQQDRLDRYLGQLDLTPAAPAPDVALEPDLLNLLAQRGQVVKTAAGVVFSAAAYQQMTDRIMSQLKLKGKISLAEVRDLLGTSRKYAQALLEDLDEKKITRRTGDDRVKLQ
jgi:selenocysteine-specific elongation factor